MCFHHAFPNCWNDSFAAQVQINESSWNIFASGIALFPIFWMNFFNCQSSLKILSLSSLMLVQANSLPLQFVEIYFNSNNWNNMAKILYHFLAKLNFFFFQIWARGIDKVLFQWWRYSSYDFWKPKFLIVPNIYPFFS